MSNHIGVSSFLLFGNNFGLDVEQAVVYSTLPHEYSTLTFRGGVVAGGGGVEGRSEVIYWHRTNTVIYYMYHNSHSCIA